MADGGVVHPIALEWLRKLKKESGATVLRSESSRGPLSSEGEVVPASGVQAKASHDSGEPNRREKDLTTPTAPRLLSPAEADRLRRAWPKPEERSATWELGRVHVHRLADSHDLLTAAITALSPEDWQVVIRRAAHDSPAVAAALRTLAALAEQIGGEG